MCVFFPFFFVCIGVFLPFLGRGERGDEKGGTEAKKTRQQGKLVVGLLSQIDMKG